ncbi:glycosyltransferase [Sneathiella aquimaris]|uniref:glycosyltransferase n=1 Tax=Sneathiella aquimaris TaxID=2599305 RepID=UPI00146ED249|nr:glycosyltransferase [Sneathiella aquimaris]
MKVMQAIGGAGHGGAETFFVNLAGAFHRSGFDQLLTMRANETRKIQLLEQGLTPIELRFGGKFDFFTRRKLQHMANTYKPDMFMSWMSRASDLTPDGNFPKLARLGGYYKLKYFQKSNHLIGNTEALCDFIIQQGWPAQRTHYIPNFLTWKSVPPIDRASLNTPEGATVLLSLGRLHHNKAMDTALKVLADLDNCYLWIAGAGDLLADLQKLADTLDVTDRVRFLGWRTDKEALFAAADICLYPSRIEPFGNVTLDAWASGTPIVAAASAGPAAYITHGVNGLLADVDNVGELSAHVRSVVEESGLSETLTKNGLAEYNQKFTEQVAVQNWKSLFEQVT